MAYEKLENYIKNYWQNLYVPAKQELEGYVSLPHGFIAPSAELQNGFVFLEQFYWDTYFIGLGLDDPEMKKGMLENLFYMFEKFGYIPNSSNIALHSGRSQPPVLTLLIKQVFEQTQDHEWLERAYQVAVKEYKNIWMSKHGPHQHLVYNGLSRYYNANQTHRGAEDESGWDYTTRFDDRALDFLPIDLNCLLYKYEIDLFFFANQLGKSKEAHEWAGASVIRKKRINTLMFNEVDNFYYDYDYVNQKQGTVKSLAGFFPLFVGMVNETEAQALVKNLDDFLTDFGLTTTPKDQPATPGKQWSSPNGWAPLHYIVVDGLKHYGFTDLATDIASRWVATVEHKFEETGVIFEKYNVVDPKQEPTSAVYPDQRGFGWTNAVTLRFIEDFSLNQLSTSEKAVYTQL